VQDSGFGVKIFADKVPLIPETLNYAAMGLIPAGAYRNREFREAMTEFSPNVDRLIQHILFDPQTSGGLLICVEKGKSNDLLAQLRKRGMEASAIIGEVIGEPVGKIIIT